MARDERELINSENWIPPKRRADAARAAQPPTRAEYSITWLDSRTLCDLGHARTIERCWTSTSSDLGEYRLHTITPVMVRNWHTTLAPKTPTYRAHAYSLLRMIMSTAVTEQLIVSNTCVVRDDGISKTIQEPRHAGGADDHRRAHA